MTSAPGSLSVVTRHAPNNLKRAALFAALFVCVGLGITLFLAATQWFSEWTPLYIMAAASLPITFITTVISTSQEDESSLKRMLPSAIVALFVSMTLGLLGGMMWREVNVRMWALESAASRGAYGVLQQAIQSKDQESAAIACGVMLGSKDPTARGKALDALQGNPALTGACLNFPGLSQEKRETLADLLTDRWWTRIESSKGEEATCQWAEALGTLEEVTTSGDVALLSCAMSASSEPLRECCAENLAKRDIVGGKLAARVGAFSYKAYEEAMAEKLLASAFTSGSLKANETSRAKKLMLTAPQMRGYALEHACDTITLDESSIPMAREFYGMTDALCGLRSPKLREDTVFWVGVCSIFKAEAAEVAEVSSNQKKLEGTICAYTKREMVGTATDAAVGIVHAAIRNNGDGNTFTNEEGMLGSINRAATAMGSDGRKLYSVSNGQYAFGRNDTGYVSANIQENQLVHARQQEYRNSRAYKEIEKSAEDNERADKASGKANTKKYYSGPNSMSVKEAMEIQKRFKQR